MRFVDIFAGLGGFHLALKGLGHTCVFASELTEELRNIYEKNFGIRPEGDIKEISPSKIPRHEILCAGFPCQPFSKAGQQEGFNCPKSGDLFDYVISILNYHKPKFVLLENVPNLLSHNKGKTWASILLKLEQLGYSVAFQKLSPHKFGIPQIRERVFIVASRFSLNNFEWPQANIKVESSISSILDSHPSDAKPISAAVRKCLTTWQDFLELFPADEPLPAFPIWTMEFGATYPYQKTTPFSIGNYRLHDFKGAFGERLDCVNPKYRLALLPSYAQSEDEIFPDWKVEFIRKNRELYEKHKQWIRPWLSNLKEFPPTWQKLEWNCGNKPRNIWKYLIQFRASGVRVKLPTTSPSLVAMNTTQVPIIAWEKRYITINECARLQSFDKLKYLPESPAAAYRALGNAVNSSIVKLVAKNLLVEKSQSSSLSTSHRVPQLKYG